MSGLVDRNQRCSECGKQAVTEVVMVRLYERRYQRDFRYRLCGECKSVLRHLLRDNSVSVQRTLNDWHMLSGLEVRS